jgi:ubiquinone/menaquinone biosynthesis C-methylase UbiE
MSMDSFESRVAEANRSCFDQEAPTYDIQEGCMVDERCRRVVAEHLQRLVALLQARFPGQALRGLDAGGGTGNIALQLRALGLSADLIDVSPEMIKHYLLKLPQEVRDSVKATCIDINSYLIATEDHYHLICFSSVLHHLANYKSVIKLAVTRLMPGGIIYTIHDPCKSSKFWHKVEMADYHFSNFTRFRNYLRYKIGGPGRVPARAVNINPEPHVESGIDDAELVWHLEQGGMQIIWHERYYKARTLPVTFLHYAALKPRGFSLAISK